MKTKNEICVSQSFTRYYPNKNNKRRSLTAGGFLVRHTLMPDKKDRVRNHRKWFRINSNNGNIYRVLQFDPTLPGPNEKGVNKIVIDWEGWLELVGANEGKTNTDDPVVLTINRAKIFEVFFKASCNHPEPSYRLSFKIAIISFCVGVLSLVIALISYFN